MKQFNFRKRTMRNDFTTIFGGIGRRRLVYNPLRKKQLPLRFKLQKIRRAHQGWRNRIFGSIHALKIRRMYGRRPVIAQFRR